MQKPQNRPTPFFFLLRIYTSTSNPTSIQPKSLPMQNFLSVQISNSRYTRDFQSFRACLATKISINMHIVVH